MAVPTPSIKPALIPGCSHTLRYVGPVHIGPGAEGQKATAIAELVYQADTSPLTYENDVVPGMRLQNPDSGLTFVVLDVAYDEFGEISEGSWFVFLQSEEDRSLNNVMGPGAEFVFVGEPTSQRWTGARLHSIAQDGVDAVAGSDQLHIDLTSLSPSLRSTKHFVDTLQVQFEVIDPGITGASPIELTAEHFGGSPIEFVRFSVQSSDVANYCAITVHSPHTTGR
jgi:hypothetical protein